MVSREVSDLPIHRNAAPWVIHELAPGLPAPWGGRIRRGKLRPPDLSEKAIARPRIQRLIDRDAYPLTLMVAPAGFGKTIAAAQWASAAQCGWLIADADDASLSRFWAHLRLALQIPAPGIGELVSGAIDVPHRVSPIALGRLLADELLDATAPVRIVIDDLHAITTGPVCSFLEGLLEIPAPMLRLLVTSRNEPPLPLNRLRIRDQVNEIRGDNLLFSDDEIRAVIGDVASDAGVREVRRRTAGWAAGLRLASPARDAAGPFHVVGGVFPDQPAIDAAAGLFDETLPVFSSDEQIVLIHAALPDQFSPELVSYLLADSGRTVAVGAVIDRARAADLCRCAPDGNGEWLEFHSIFRSVLRQRIESTKTPAALAQLHQTAAEWFTAHDRIDDAISHLLAARHPEQAVALVESRFHRALAAEDRPAIERWLRLLPEDEIARRPRLMLARGWLAHLRGRFTAKREIVRIVEQQIAEITESDRDPATIVALRAEVDTLRLDNAIAWQINPESVIQTAERAVANLPPDRRFPIGFAWLNLGIALHCSGQTEAGEQAMREWLAKSPAGADGGSIRGLFGLSLFYLQAADLAQAERSARTMIDLAHRHQLRLSAGWGHAILGDVLFEQNRLDEAVQQHLIVSRDFEYEHFLCIREALFTLAQSYLALGLEADAAGAMRRAHDILIAAEAVEHLPVLAAYEAWLALLTGDPRAALHWARGDALDVDSSSLFTSLHPVTIKAAIFSAVGDAAEGDAAIELLTELRARVVRVHLVRPLVRIDALLAVARHRRGQRQGAQEAMHASLALGIPRGCVRSILDLVRLFPHEMSDLLAGHDVPPAVREAFAPQPFGSQQPTSRELLPPAGLTRRELEILAALGQGSTYDEIGERLFISPHTVKRHACNIYGKLGVSGRFEALQAARGLGVQVGSTFA